jgi:hypothetical protein
MAANFGPQLNNRFKEIEPSEMRFLISGVVFSRTDEKRNADIRQELNIFN